MIQICHALVYTQRALYPATEILAHPCLLLLCPQYQRNEVSLDPLQQKNGLGKCHVYTQWTFIQL